MIKESTYQKDTIILSVSLTELQQDDKDDEEKITFNFENRQYMLLICARPSFKHSSSII